MSAELAASRRTADEQKTVLVQSQTQLREAFASLSQDALRENRTDFLHNADAMLQPVRETLDRVQDQLVDVDKAREGSYRAVTAQLTELSGAQQGAARRRRRPHPLASLPARPRQWGELQLRRIVELAGMTRQCDFIEKPSGTTDAGARQTPDLVVTLPGGAAHRDRLEGAD